MHPAIPHHLVKPRPSPDSYSVHCSYNAAHGVTASESAHSEPQRTLQNSKGRGTTRAAHAAGPCQSPRQRHGALHTRRISAWLRARTRLRRKISRRLPATAHVVPVVGASKAQELRTNRFAAGVAHVVGLRLQMPAVSSTHAHAKPCVARISLFGNLPLTSKHPLPRGTS